jgi:hypothetical protein
MSSYSRLRYRLSTSLNLPIAGQGQAPPCILQLLTFLFNIKTVNPQIDCIIPAVMWEQNNQIPSG